MGNKSSRSIALVLTLASCLKAGENEKTSATEGTSGSTSSTSTGPTPTQGDTSGVSTNSTDASTSSTTGIASTTQDHGTTSGSATTSDSVCGDGIVEGPEQCDLGEENADEGLSCTGECLKPRCGDGHVQALLGEGCDLGDDYNDDHGACLSDCKPAACGDGHEWYGVEECDLGAENQDGLYGGCMPMTCTRGPHCDDGIVQKPQEECDLGEDNGKDGPCDEVCKLSGKMVFVTSKSYKGKLGLGGAAGADDACNIVAMEAGLANAGNFRAWISDGESSPSQWNPPPMEPYVLSNVEIIAESWTDLRDGTLAVPLMADENGAEILEEPLFAWTGTSAAGQGLIEHCGDWKSDGKEATLVNASTSGLSTGPPDSRPSARGGFTHGLFVPPEVSPENQSYFEDDEIAPLHEW